MKSLLYPLPMPGSRLLEDAPWMGEPYDDDWADEPVRDSEAERAWAADDEAAQHAYQARLNQALQRVATENAALMAAIREINRRAAFNAADREVGRQFQRELDRLMKED